MNEKAIEAAAEVLFRKSGAQVLWKDAGLETQDMWLSAARAAITAYEAANGWLFVNPDTGIEYSEQHPIDSGEVPDAESIRPATASNLLPLLIEAWEETERYREAARRSAVAVNTASSRIKELEAAVVKLRWALEPFAEVAEWDIGDNESDSDTYRPMDARNSVSGNISIGHLKRAHEVMQDTDWVADKIRAAFEAIGLTVEE